jgi:hypothetical protein
MRYLGFQLKIGASSPEDWQWLIKLFERKIGGWCFKWLSLGGRLILVKSVLEGLAVYWMSLERIPSKIINTLRRLTANFLWNGHGKKHSFHLCSWEIIARPKKAGGWGIKNLHIFNTALLASTFWRALTHESIWNRIIVEKYLGSLKLSDWLRKPSLHLKWASPFWKGLIASSPIILHWLRWLPGSGTEIKIGRDMIVGMEDCSILPPDMCSDLLSQNFPYLAQIKIPTASPSLPDNWKGVRDLSFIGWRAIAWNHYTAELKCAGISLKEEPDSLVWAGGDASGIPSVKNIFDALLSLKNLVPDLSWRQQVWKWKIPLKYKLFVWLAGIDRILTWDSLRRRGWEGPGFCSLCRQAPEDIHHLLIHCKFTKEVWSRLLTQFNLPFSWSGDTITDCFNSWLLNKSSPTCLAAHISWHLWIERNRALFENRSPSTLAVFYRVLATFSWQPSTLKPFIYKEIDLRLPVGFTLACFDGAAQANGSCCGAGGFFRAHPERITKWSLNCGPGNKHQSGAHGALGFTLSGFLLEHHSFAHLWRFKSHHRLDFEKISSPFYPCESWKQKTLDLASGIPNLSFQHVYRVYNREADILSKKALREETGRLSIFHSDKGIESPITQFSIF